MSLLRNKLLGKVLLKPSENNFLIKQTFRKSFTKKPKTIRKLFSDKKSLSNPNSSKISFFECDTDFGIFIILIIVNN